MHVWLDLEATIITCWEEGFLINQEVIKSWLDENNIGDINIWSFALWDEKDRDEFITSGMKSAIEKVLDRRILTHPCIREMRAMIFKTEKLKYISTRDFIQINGKHWSFIKFCMGEHPDKKCVLIDDMVPSIEIRDSRTQGEIILINIEDLKQGKVSDEQKTATVEGVIA